MRTPDEVVNLRMELAGNSRLANAVQDYKGPKDTTEENKIRYALFVLSYGSKMMMMIITTKLTQ
jgi:hypothetical protein